MPGVGNVGDFKKTFFGGGRRRGFSEEQKHRTSLHKTSVLLRQNIGTFPQRSPMFLISGTGKNDSYGSLYGVFYKLV